MPILHDMSLEGRLVALLEEVEEQRSRHMLSQCTLLLMIAEDCRRLLNERTQETLQERQIEPGSPRPNHGYAVDQQWSEL